MLAEDSFMAVFGGSSDGEGLERMPQIAAMATRHGYVVVPMVEGVPFCDPLDGEVSRTTVMSAFRRAVRKHGAVDLGVLPGPSGFLAVQVRDETHAAAFAAEIGIAAGSYTVSHGLGGQFWYRLPAGIVAPPWAGVPVIVPPSAGYVLHTPPVPAPEGLLRACGLTVTPSVRI